MRLAHKSQISHLLRQFYLSPYKNVNLSLSLSTNGKGVGVGADCWQNMLLDLNSLEFKPRVGQNLLFRTTITCCLRPKSASCLESGLLKPFQFSNVLIRTPLDSWFGAHVLERRLGLHNLWSVLVIARQQEEQSTNHNT